MSNEKERPPLGDSGGVIAGRLATSVTGTIPFVGPIIQQVISETIPNVRLERVETYLWHLDQRLDQLALSSVLESEERLDLFEEGMWQSARAVTKERKKRIADIVSKGLTDKEENLQEARHWLRLLNNFGDHEISILLEEYILHETIPKNEDKINERSKGLSDLYRSAQMRLSAFGLIKFSPLAGGGYRVTGLTDTGVSFLRYVGLIDEIPDGI